MKGMKKRFLHNAEVKSAPHDRHREYDVYLERFIKHTREVTIKEQDDDYLLILVGPTGTGKSRLLLHIYELFDPEGCSIDYVSLKKEDFADSLKKAKNKEGLRFVGNDEANINKRDSMSKYNKDVMDLYFSIRGLNMFHVWCNPSIDMIDKIFIEERIRGLILVNDKSPERRCYYFFKRKALLEIFESFGNLKLRNLIKARKRYAYYKGWFRDYKGRLLRDYLDKKGNRMKSKIDDFHTEWGSDDCKDFVTRQAMADRLGVKLHTIARYEKKLMKEGLIVEGHNFFKKGNVFGYGEEVYHLFLEKFIEARM